MSKVHKSDDASSSPPSPAMVIITSIADTTWRMFVPTIGLLLVGIYFDGKLHTKPILAAAGVIVGSVLAGILIKRQLDRN